ncbi:FadR/GntR family transcriptional regulator [Granulosicoccus sp. 3-233]|uniref:FadR/GntR family transcriptional regulator n=1 Tax=Granulosicoccus sp. 3-233 TaxID=3417969 RepID=UPI003D34E8DB
MSRHKSPVFAGSFEGVIEVRGILGSAVNILGTRIVRGDWPVGGVVAREADLVEELQVSRSVIREAFRILGAKGMIRSRTSDGTRVQPRSEWRLLDPDVMDWRIKAGETESLLRDLLRVRLILEPGVAYHATVHADDAGKQAVHDAWAAKVEIFDAPGLSHEERRNEFIRADLQFHRAFLSIAGSELLDQLYAVIEAALSLLLDLQMQARGYTTELIGMDEGHALHEEVYNAFAAGDAPLAERAMRELIKRAIDDANQGFLLLER